MEVPKTPEQLTFFIINGVIKRGNFKLKCGKSSTYYFNFRDLYSKPEFLRFLSSQISLKIEPGSKICPVPIGAIPLSSFLCCEKNLPMIIPRFLKKEYGMESNIDGILDPNDKIVIIEDVITSGSSIKQVIELLKEKGVYNPKIIVIFDRQESIITDFTYKSLYTRTMYMRDKLESLSSGKTRYLVFKEGEVDESKYPLVSLPCDCDPELIRNLSGRSFLLMGVLSDSTSFEDVRGSFDLFYSETIKEGMNSLIVPFDSSDPRVSGRILSTIIIAGSARLAPEK